MSAVALLKDDLLANVPSSLRSELLFAYGEILKNFRERRWEPSELNGGKLCEVVYSILKGHVSGTFPPRSNKPRNMVDACRNLENASASFSRSVRIQMPRMLVALYEVRNNRGVGHVGGDVDPNHMDATCVVEMSKWLMSELVRVFHNVSTEDATAAVDALVERTVPLVWEIGDKRRVLDPKMTMKDRTLVLLYHRHGAIDEATLRAWAEHNHSSRFRRDILRPCHVEKLLEYDEQRQTVEISPLGVDYVERMLANA